MESFKDQVRIEYCAQRDTQTVDYFTDTIPAICRALLQMQAEIAALQEGREPEQKAVLPVVERKTKKKENP